MRKSTPPRLPPASRRNASEAPTSSKDDDGDDDLDSKASVNKHCPLLAFLYTLYCNEPVAAYWVREYNKAKRTGKGAKDEYLKQYEADDTFPAAARTLITVTVPAKGKKPAKRNAKSASSRQPTKEQAYMLMADLATELSKLSPSRSSAKGGSDHSTNPERAPILACLAAAYVNQNSDYGTHLTEAVKQFKPPAGARKVLLKIAEEGVPTIAQMLELAEFLVPELTKPPTPW